MPEDKKILIHDISFETNANLDDFIHKLMNLKFELEEKRNIDLSNTTMIIKSETVDNRLKLNISFIGTNQK